MEHWKALLNTGIIPFVLSAAQTGGKGPKVNWTRLVEIVVSGMIIVIGVVSGISNRLDQLDYRLAKIEATAEQTQGTVDEVKNEQSRRTPMINYIEGRMNK